MRSVVWKLSEKDSFPTPFHSTGWSHPSSQEKIRVIFSGEGRTERFWPEDGRHFNTGGWSDSLCVLNVGYREPQTFSTWLPEHTPLPRQGVERNFSGESFFFFFLRFIYLLMAELDLGCCTQAFSSCGKQGPISSGGEQASPCGGFPCCRARALGHTGSVVVAHGLIYPVACGPSQTRARIHVPCTGRWILN